MEKPTLFLSHASIDKDYLKELKDMLYKKTSGTIEIFLSSDGQSIPFGTNWVHSVETALDEASVMFVAISPRSINSPWLYFEAGFTYSREVKVVPLGIMGLDIAGLSPPLSLLQGFNITSEEGLNNIVAVINSVYGYNFKEDFNHKDFDCLRSVEPESVREGLRLTEIVDFIEADLSSSVGNATNKRSIRDNPSDIVFASINKLGIEHYPIGNDTIMLPGIRIQVGKSSKAKDTVVVTMDPLCANLGITIIRELFRSLYDFTPQYYWFRVFFPESTKVLTEDYKITSRLTEVGINIFPEHGKLLQYQNVLFAIDKNYGDHKQPCLRIVAKTERDDNIPLLELIDTLVDVGIVIPNIS